MAVPETRISGIHLGLFLTLIATALSSVAGVAAVFGHELSPIQDDIREIKEDVTRIKDDIQEIRAHPVPQYVLDNIEAMRGDLIRMTLRVDNLETE